MKYFKVFAASAIISGCASQAGTELPQIATSKYQVITLATDLDRPWAVAELSPEQYIITERSGQIRLFNDGKLSAPIVFPVSVFDQGQGGLLDVSLDPNYADNGWLYFSFAAGNQDNNGTQLIRAQLNKQQTALINVEKLFKAMPLKKGSYHYGGRIEFLNNDTLVMPVGDAYLHMEDAQQLDSHLGKIIRIKSDGSIPKDNPFIGKTPFSDAIYSYGHRNPQGLIFDKQTNTLYANEHGPRGGDELNIIEAGNNYGWPKATYGVNYNFTTITDDTSLPGMIDPKINWTPSIAPSSLAHYSAKDDSPWSQSLLTTTLKFKQLRVISSDGNYHQQIALKELDDRLRDVLVDSSNNLIFVTDSGKLIQVK
ncbi:PQQ-dependent sugar dehydrogenase [Paraferrimonas sp. SM1919]|uniref:PQQ-dependent sugar dehydrogenase n=1 Tax=Paraferrimonas sp. SM1919 TaxID=2662263 RepID=UPI0013D27825|nr:PQQ-dependent sugar dehydrogenase [Paraferrimonas sp. SM1919]